MPIMLVSQLKVLYLWWIGWDYSYASSKWIYLELVPPKEVLTPIKAMEDVFAVIWPIYDSGNWRERWMEGELNNTPFWMSWEIVSIEGRIHFYLRILTSHRGAIETAIYGAYPDIEIREVTDSFKLVPKNIPNEEWDLYGEDFVLARPAAYPLKTYEKFFEPQGERISAEEKRIDPMSSLLELMARLGPGENFWLQYILMPILDYDEPEWRKEGAAIVTKLSKRPEKKEPTFLEDLGYVFRQLIMGPDKEGSGEGAKYSWTPIAKTETGEREMVLTPGEREMITEIENKMRKPA